MRGKESIHYLLGMGVFYYLELDTQAVNVVVSDTEEFNVSLEDGQLYLDVVIEFMELPA